ncbi:MAG: DMT family transporter [Duodenibacillus sp.]|nr:DMT family transporter [Duodenibacillus sp.]
MQSLWMLLASFLFAVMASTVKLASPDLGTFTMVAWRGLFGVVLLGGWSLARGRSMRTDYFASHMARSGAGTLALAMWMYALVYLPLSTGTTLNYTSPLWMALLLSIAALIKGERIEYKLIAVCLVGFAGVVQVLQPEFHASDVLPAALGLASGLLSAVAYIQIKQLSNLKEPEWRVVFYFSLFNLVFGVTGHLLFEEPDVYTVRSALCAVGCGLSATIAQIAMTRSYGSGNLLVSSILSFSGIVFASLIGITVFDDPVQLTTYLGIALIIAAGVAASVLTKKPRAPKAR